jgi:cyclopropane-fatty-acyl-phospholipid synthase
MNTTTASPLALPPGIPAAARTVLRLLTRLQHGSLTLQLPDGALRHFGPGGAPHGAIVLHNWKVCGAALRSGDIGFAESYIAGDWSTPHLTDLLKLLIANRHAVESVVYGSWAGRLASRLRHLLRRNTRAGSKKNIHAHYDLGNAFYQLWLDETMNYSSALFSGPEPTQDLHAAQHAKVRRALARDARAAGRARAGDWLRLGGVWPKWRRPSLAPASPALRCRPNSWPLPMQRLERSACPLRSTICACRTTATSTMHRLTPSARSRWWRP